MFIVTLTYLKPLADIETQLQPHRTFLDAHYASGVFLASGPKNPRDGGVILASSRITRAALDAVLAQDPFHQRGLAAYAVTEFAPVKFHPALGGIL